MTIAWILPPRMKERVRILGARLTQRHVLPLQKTPNVPEARRDLDDAQMAEHPGTYRAGGARRLKKLRDAPIRHKY